MLRKLFALTALLALLTGCAPASSSVQPDPVSTQDSSSSTVPINSSTSTGFTLTSTDATDGGQLPIEFTCDGDGSTLPLTWSGAPDGTQSYAVIMHHV
ncbi:MAG TPA: hypothetical protein PLG52_08690, partial [Anaerolineales bacterium]|nr:hypothetical protein [Anaerolineales bacterium]